MSGDFMVRKSTSQLLISVVSICFCMISILIILILHTGIRFCIQNTGMMSHLKLLFPIHHTRPSGSETRILYLSMILVILLQGYSLQNLKPTLLLPCICLAGLQPMELQQLSSFQGFCTVDELSRKSANISLITIISTR